MTTENKQDEKPKFVFKHTFYESEYAFPIHYQEPIDPKSRETLSVLWDENKQMTYDEFYAEYDDQVCTDWNKKTPAGVHFGGAWDEDNEDYNDEDYSDPSKITRRENGQALFRLPYPPQTILFACRHLCTVRCEGVIEVDDWLAWVDHSIKHPDDPYSKYPSMMEVPEEDKEPEPSGHCTFSRIEDTTIHLTHEDGTSDIIPLNLLGGQFNFVLQESSLIIVDENGKEISVHPISASKTTTVALHLGDQLRAAVCEAVQEYRVVLPRDHKKDEQNTQK